MKHYKEIRIMYYDDLRSVCIRNDYYTRGTNAEYEALFGKLRDGCCNLRNITTELLAEIATDIKAHSDTEDEITDIMYNLARVCISCFEEV